MAHYEYFPVELQELQKEIQQHPKLLLILNANAHAGFPYLFGQIGEYCGMMLDGLYSGDDIVRLAGIMVEKLREIGVIEVNEPGKIVVHDVSGGGIILPAGFKPDLH